MPMSRRKFATQVDAALLEEMRGLAEQEGRQIQTLVDEAFAQLLEQRRAGRTRRHVMDAYARSHDQYASVYRKLAE